LSGPRPKSETTVGPAPRRIFTALFGAIFATLLGAGIVAPLLPVYARSLGAGGLTIGFIFAAFSITRTVFLPYFSRLSDRRGRRNLILAGLFFYALCSLLYTLGHSTSLLIATRLLQGGAAAMVWPIAAAYVGDITPPGREGTYMGLFNLATFSGLAAGPFLGGILKDLAGINAAFYAMGGMTLLGFGLAFVLLPAQEPYRARPQGRQPGSLQILREYRVLRGIFLFRFLATSCIALVWSFQPLYLDTVHHLSASWIGLLISLNVAVSAALQAPMGRLADRFSRIRMIQIGAGIQALALILLPFCHTLDLLLAVNIGLGVAGGIFLPAIQAIITEVGREAKMMGAIMGTLFVAQSLGMSVGPLLAGALFGFVDFRVIFYVGSGLVVLSLVPVLVYLKPAEATSSAARPGR